MNIGPFCSAVTIITGNQQHQAKAWFQWQGSQEVLRPMSVLLTSHKQQCFLLDNMCHNLSDACSIHGLYLVFTMFKEYRDYWMSLSYKQPQQLTKHRHNYHTTQRMYEFMQRWWRNLIHGNPWGIEDVKLLLLYV